jgi:hypothetical protein
MGIFKKRVEKEKPETSELNNQDRLKNILYGAKDILSHGYKDKYDLHPIFSYIKILTDKIVFSYTVETLALDKDNHTLMYDLNGLMFDFEELDKNGITGYKMIRDNKNEVSLTLVDCPVIVSPWSRQRLTDAVCDIGGESCAWTQDKKNHFFNLCYPLGVCFVYQGNHSILSGKVKGDGVITIAPGIMNLTPLYDTIYFDGDYYRKRSDDEIIAKALNFEFGCVFEIGRRILEYEICFKGLKISE